MIRSLARAIVTMAGAVALAAVVVLVAVVAAVAIIGCGCYLTLWGPRRRSGVAGWALERLRPPSAT